MKRRRGVWLGLLGLVACSSEEPQIATTTAASSAPQPEARVSATASSRATRGSDEIEPVYPKDNLPPEPFATRYCDAIHRVPSTQRAECCKETARAPASSECVRTLSSALRSKAITIDETALASCEAASTKLYAGCDWVGLGVASAATECLDILNGTLAANAVCRSSLECGKGLRCQGLGATQPGRCAPPREKDAVCGTGVDVLASLTAQDTWELRHPECAGLCVQHRCADASPSACKSSVECGPNRSCRAGKCSDQPLPSAGEPCAADACARGLRCVSGKCRKAALAGAACAEDIECAGRCEKGKCVQQCQRAMPADLVPRHSASAGSAAPAPKP